MVQQIDLNIEWSLIASNMTTMSVQNTGQWPVYLSWSDSDATPPTDPKGIVWKITERTYKLDPLVTFNVNAAHVWARSISKRSKVIVDIDPLAAGASYAFDAYVATGYWAP